MLMHKLVCDIQLFRTHASLDSMTETVNSAEYDRKHKFFVSVEPILFVNAIGVSMSVNIFTELIIRQACASYGVEVGDCMRNSTLEDASHRTAAAVNAFLPYIAMVLPCILVILVGPWSEKNGRMPFMIISTIGQILLWSALGIESAIVNLPPFFLLVGYVVPALTGGSVVVTTLCYCYLADISTDENKTLRVTLGASSTILGNCLAPLIAGWIISDGTYYQYITVYAFNVMLEVAVLAYAICFLRDPISVEGGIKWNLFNRKHFIAMYRVVRNTRRQNVQLLILLAYFLIFISGLFQFGEVFMLFLCVKKAFKWTVESYATFSAVQKAVTCVFTSVGVWFFSSYLKTTDLLLNGITLAIYLMSTVIFVLTTTPAMFYTASIIASINHVPTVLSKAMIAKSVSQEEVGSAMALCTILESICAPAASTIYAIFYSAVESKRPFDVFYLSMALSLVGLITLGAIYLVQRGKSNSVTSS